MITTFLATPPHPVQCDGTGAARRRVLGDSKISLLQSLLAVSTRLIQCVTASPYLHTNKRADVDSYRCPPLRVPAFVVTCQFSFPLFSLKTCRDVRLEKPLNSPRAIRAVEPPLTWIRQHKEGYE